MKKFKITDKFLLKCRKVLSDFSVVFVFTFGIGLGLMVSPAVDPNKVSEISGSLIGASIYFIVLIQILYLVITSERIFLFLKSKEGGDEK